MIYTSLLFLLHFLNREQILTDITDITDITDTTRYTNRPQISFLLLFLIYVTDMPCIWEVYGTYMGHICKKLLITLLLRA